MIANWISEVTATTGTGAISLGGAPSGHAPFSSVFGDGEMALYTITDGNNREAGIGTLTAGTPWMLTRSSVLETLVSGVLTTNGATALSLSGSATVAISPMANGGAVLDTPLVDNVYYYPGSLGLTSATTLSSVANTAYCAPFLVRQAQKIDALRINIGTADAAATTAKIGIYNSVLSAASAKPRLKLAETSFNATVTGASGGTITGGQVLKPGWHWVVVATIGVPVYNRTFNRDEVRLMPYDPQYITAPHQVPMRSTVLTAGWSALPDDLSAATFTESILAPAVHMRYRR